jgi:type IV pilus assembly protein PilB
MSDTVLAPRNGRDVNGTPASPPEEPNGKGLQRASIQSRSPRMIGEVVVEMGFADRATVDGAIEVARAQGRPSGTVLVEQGILTHDQLARVVSERFGVDYVDLSVFDLDMGAVNLITAQAAKRFGSVPIGFGADGAVLLAMSDPTNVLVIDDVAMMTGRRVRPVAASVEDLELLLTRLTGMDESIEDFHDDDIDVDDEAGSEAEAAGDQDAPVIRLVHSIIAQAVERRASDVHLNPEEGDTRVMFRIDGVLVPAATVKRRMALGVVSRIKIMADLDISERRMPQDGRFALTLDGRRVDIRVVTLPLVAGEGVMLRILDRSTTIDGLDSLGMPPAALERFTAAISRPSGAVLVTGPTGSGKSTTLYAALGVVNDGQKSILTIEDPVEQRIAGIKQMQVAPKAGLTFDAGLRSMLRADPDVIMVGEIRDRETARIAVEAALTGHLVLSTIHTRDAAKTPGRLMDMGIEPFLVSSAVDSVVAQRLVRVLCQHCKAPQRLPKSVRGEYGLGTATVYEAVGCSRCSGSGYRGRVGVYEVMTISEPIRALILERGSAAAIAAVAIAEGMGTLRDDGMEKVRDGVTSIAEVERMVGSVV